MALRIESFHGAAGATGIGSAMVRHAGSTTIASPMISATLSCLPTFAVGVVPNALAESVLSTSPPGCDALMPSSAWSENT